jgi:cyanate lyase
MLASRASAACRVGPSAPALLASRALGRRALHHHGGSALALAERTERVLAAKARSGKSYDELAKDLGVTNTFAAQLLLGQAQLRPETASKLEAAIPGLEADDLAAMKTCPMRSFDPAVLQEPLVYRFYEAITHYARPIKLIINEQCGAPPPRARAGGGFRPLGLAWRSRARASNRFREGDTRAHRARAHTARVLTARVCAGDGIMSAIDFYLDVGTSTGVNGERRVIVTMVSNEALATMLTPSPGLTPSPNPNA